MEEKLGECVMEEEMEGMSEREECYSDSFERKTVEVVEGTVYSA